MKFLSQRGVVRDVRCEDEGDSRGGGEIWESDLNFQIRKYRSSHSANIFPFSGRSFTLVIGGGE